MSKDRVLNNPVLMARQVQQKLKQQRKLVYASIDPSDGSRRMIPEPEAIAEDAIMGDNVIDEDSNAA